MKTVNTNTSILEEVKHSKKITNVSLATPQNTETSNQGILNSVWDEIKTPVEKDDIKISNDKNTSVVDYVWALTKKPGMITKDELAFIIENQDKPIEQVLSEYQEKQKKKEEENKIRYSFDNNEKLRKLNPKQRKEVVDQVSRELDVAEEMTEEYLETRLK